MVSSTLFEIAKSYILQDFSQLLVGVAVPLNEKNISRNDGSLKNVQNEAWIPVPEKSPLVFQGLVLLEKNTVKQLSFKQFLL